MPLPTKRWQVAQPLTPEADLALKSFPKVLRQILYNRGYANEEDALRFLQAGFPKGTEAFNMLGLQPAATRLAAAIQNQEQIVIYGDYDADGVTATALLVQVLRGLGAKARPYIPNRFDEGYGLNKEALDSILADGAAVVVTVDCGIRSPEEALHARTLGLDLIITDHHHPEETLPQAFAIVNPKQPGDSYPDKDLAGVGLAYKLAQGLVALMQAHGIPTHGVNVEDFLDLVAIGTVADLAPLTGENRALVRRGLEMIRRARRQGLVSLMRVAGIQPARVNAGDIGFVIGPRLNAAGRLESALAALELLTTSSLAQAGLLAQQLDNQNRERQRLTQQIQTQAEAIAMQECPDGLLLFAAHPDFNPGVVGLAASRLTDVYYRPSIVAYQGEEFTRGSCRSIPEFHITEALDECAPMLVHHGGHAAAAGFTVRNEDLPRLLEQLNAIALRKLANQNLCATICADVDIPLSQLHPSLLDHIDLLQPTGYGNSQAVFVSRNLEVTSARPVGKEGAHLKLTVNSDRVYYDAIAFRQGHWHGQIPQRIDLMYTFELNEFNGRTSLQLNVKDLKAAGTPD
jgi:single-stranded-DNA-specific exonuclease